MKNELNNSDQNEHLAQNVASKITSHMETHSRAKWVAIAVLGIAIVIGAVIFSTFYYGDKTISRGDDKIEKTVKGISAVYSDIKGGLKVALTPADKSKTTYIVDGNIKEEWLAVTASREAKIDHAYSAEWFGSTKDINLVGVYKISAGVDLSKVVYEFQGEIVLVRGVNPVLISCERLALKDLDESNGLWNNVQDEDRVAAQNALDGVAREHAAKSEELLTEAKKNFIEKLQQGPGMESSTYRFIADPSE